MQTPIIKTTCPADSELRSFIGHIDFEDAYAFRTPESPASMEALYAGIFNTAPAWVEYAMRLRNMLVAPFGLKTEIDKNQTPLIKEGEKAGIFRIYKILENEVIAGEDDKHLNFRVSVHRKPGRDAVITVTTMVHYNNLFGKIYMTLIAPIHKMVVKSILRSSVQRFAKDEEGLKLSGHA
jgi:hypothetical protein